MSWHAHLNERWYAQPDDLMGGWCLMTTPSPPGSGVGMQVGDFLQPEVAQHVARMHNEWLDDRDRTNGGTAA